MPYDPDDPHIDDLNEVQIPEVLQNSSDLLRHIDELGYAATKIQRKLLQGTLLDEFEFYIQRVFSIVPWVIEDFVNVGEYSEYERYCLMHYDDASQRGLIDTEMHEDCLHHEGGRLISLRRVPVQDVLVTELSKNQIQFFEQHFPVEFSEFG